jgi:murein DD-endopeptidase MepM/ murein hydrolase activator NlpD
MTKYVTPVVGAEVFVFAAPDLKAPRLTTLFPGDIVTAVQDVSGWKQVVHTNYQGWVVSHMLQEFSVGPIVTNEFYLSWPTDYKVITQGWNLHPEWYNKYGLPGHEGVDIQAPMNSNIYACAPGRVSQVITSQSHAYGNHIRIKHEKGYETIYAHLQSMAVTPNQVVSRKQLIGKADSTGNSTGSHLHLTLKRQGATANGETNFPNDIINPVPLLVRD